MIPDGQLRHGLAAALGLLLAAVSGPLAGCGGGAAGEDEALLVFAAASLADALEEAAGAWQDAHPDVPVDFSFAGSNQLARQIAAGAPADLFVAADRERLDAAERVDASAAEALLGNELVVVVPAGSRQAPAIASARDLLAFARLGLADPEAAPAGVHARRWLEAEGVWEELRARVVPALDVRANLAAVASGNVPAGVVYATDAESGLAGRVRVAYRVPPGDPAPPIVYWAAPVDGGERQAAERFLAFLRGPGAGAVFRRHGFRHLPTETATGEADEAGRAADA